MLSSLLALSNCPWTDQLTTSRAGFCFCFWFVLFAFWCFCLFCLFLGLWCLLFVLHGDSSMDYVSIHFSSLLFHIVIMTNVATALIRWICTMQLSFRLDKRPGESHLALDGKKKTNFNSHFWSCCLAIFESKTKKHLNVCHGWRSSRFSGRCSRCSPFPSLMVQCCGTPQNADNNIWVQQSSCASVNLYVAVNHVPLHFAGGGIWHGSIGLLFVSTRWKGL